MPCIMLFNKTKTDVKNFALQGFLRRIPCDILYLKTYIKFKAKFLYMQNKMGYFFK